MTVNYSQLSYPTKIHGYWELGTVDNFVQIAIVS